MINDLLSTSLTSEINEVVEWADSLYTDYFGNYFHIQLDLYKRLQSSETPITDEELQQVLIDLPLELISVSELLSQFQISQEVIKFKVKHSNDASEEIDYELISKIYSLISDRVSRQISFSRELIMSCKKIWDRRKATENVSPINPIDSGLPEYVAPEQPKTYVK